MPSTPTLVRAHDLFRHEVDQASRLGLRLQLRATQDDHGFSAYARLTPMTPKAHHAMRANAAQSGHVGKDSIEVRQAYASPTDQAPAYAQCIETALGMARDVL